MESITRVEKYLDAIENGDKNVPIPITRVEHYLYEIAQNGGGGGGATSADDVSYDNTDSGLNATNVQDAIDEIAQSGGESTPDLVISGTSNGTPGSANVTLAMQNATYNKDIDGLLAKVRATGTLDIGGYISYTETPQNGSIEHYYPVKVIASTGDGNTAQIIPKDTARAMQYPVDSDVILIKVGTAYDKSEITGGITMMNGSLTFVPIGG